MRSWERILDLMMVVSLASACGKASSERQVEITKDEADARAQENDLKPAVGRFEGQILIAESHRRIDAVLETKIVYRAVPSPADPTIIISVPKLAGSLIFPALKNLSIEDLVAYSDVTNPLGGFILAGFDLGDFDRNTKALNLPYTVAQFGTAPFGAFQGMLTNGNFVGLWSARNESHVGSFNLIRVR